MPDLRITLLMIGMSLSIFSNAQYTSIHHEQNEQFKQQGKLTEKEWDVVQGTKKHIVNTSNKSNCNLTHSVYGWNPYWVGTAYNNYDFNLLSTFSYFSYELIPSTGKYSDIHGWKTSNSINLAQAVDTKVELCVTNFGSANNNTFLTSASARQTFIDSIIVLINYRNANGVNIDFEGVGAANRNDLTSFMTQLSGQLKAAIPGATVTMAVLSVDWNNVFDLPALDLVVDQFIIMGYGYYYSGSSTAGPTDNLYSGSIWTSRNLVRSLDYYLDNGVTPSKLLLGLPYYGREFETTTNTIPSAVTGGYTSTKFYNVVKDNVSGNYSNRQYDYQAEIPYYVFQSGGNWRQTFCNDAQSLAARYDVVKQMKIGGIGIWALGYDNGYTELWNLIEQKFTDCSVIACTDTLTDKGGAFGEYRNNEAYNFTIAPTGASTLSLTFLEFDTELGFDSLWIYDGTTTADPLIGGYSGTALPSSITSTGSALTLKFYSDNATRGDGWKVVYSCLMDTIKPTTIISASPLPNTTTDFVSNFTDADNVGGSGIMHQFYQVVDYNTVEWRANNNNGFLNDDFDAAIHTDWTDSSGIWTITGAYLTQTDEVNTNTNLFVAHNQNNNNKFLYHFKARLSGTGTNKRAGFHYMSDDATQTNRGNSYFVWFRQDNSKLQFYKVVNNVFTLEKEVAITFNANQWYDYKIVYDKVTGITEIYMADKFVALWQDASPITVGNYVSLRNGNCIYDVDDLRIYHNRTASETILVGAANTNDIRYENNPNTAGRINSIAIDAAHNVSLVATEMVDVDFIVTGINSLSQTMFNVYPNPSKNKITISFNKPQTGNISLTDLSGRVLKTITLNTNIKKQVDVSSYAKGIYLIRYNNTVIKFVKD